MRVAICDDDIRQIAVIESYIKAWSQQQETPIKVQTFTSAENFLIDWTSKDMFDAVFLDIRMGKMTGVELAEHIRSQGSKMSIVFVTADREFVFRGYDVGALHYLVKPLSQEDCFKCLDRMSEHLASEETGSLLVMGDGKTIRVKLSDIIYLESLSHYVGVKTAESTLRYRKKFSDLEAELEGKSEFVKIHRSYIVNLKYVDALESDYLSLENGEELPVSRSCRKQTHKAFVSYHASN